MGLFGYKKLKDGEIYKGCAFPKKCRGAFGSPVSNEKGVNRFGCFTGIQMSLL